MIIGLGYKARSGKDTIAEILERDYHFKRTAFAQSLKDAARCIFGLTEEQLYGTDKERIDPFWQDTPRRMLQLLGTECLRNGYRDDVWVKAVRRKLVETAGAHWVISDVRFPNEAQAIKDWGGKVVRVDRDNRDAMANEKHASELAMEAFEGWDHVVENNGTIAELGQAVDTMVDEFRHKRR